MENVVYYILPYIASCEKFILEFDIGKVLFFWESMILLS